MNAGKAHGPLSVAINGWFWGAETTGSGQYLSYLLRALCMLEPTDRYLVFTPARRADAPPEAPSDNVHCVPLGTPFDGRSRNLAKVWFEQVAFPRACVAHGVDVAHVPYWGPPARIGRPLVTTVHDLIPLLLPAYRGAWHVRLYTRLVSRALRRSDLVLTDSSASADDLRRWLGIAEARLRVIYLAADPRYRPVHDAERLAAVRARYGLPATFFLYLGGFDQRKNVPGLVRAYAALRRRRPDAPALALAGRLPARDTAFFPDPRRIAQEAGVSASVHCAGWVAEEDKPALYALAMAFVFPSFYEGFGLPVLEAMACGVPVIAGRGSSLGEIVGSAGVLVEPAAEGEIAAAMERLMDDERERGRLAALGLSRAAAFRWDEAARRVRSAYVAAINLAGP